MSAIVNVLFPDHPKRILIIASNPAMSETTGWPIGFWYSELTHPYWEFRGHGYQVEIASPQGGPLQADGFSDPEDASGYAADDLISLGFKKSAKHAALLQQTKKLSAINPDDYHGIFLVGGQGPMFTFYRDEALHRFVAEYYETGKPVAIVCHASCILIKAKLSNGDFLVKGKTWTGFANSEEAYVDQFVGKKIQPFWIEEEAKKMEDTNFIVDSMFRAHAVRDGNLITGQQQNSGAAVAQLVIQALGQ